MAETPPEKSQKQLLLTTQTASLRKFYHPLIADNTAERPDSALETPWKRLRIHDDVKIIKRFGISDKDGLIGLRQDPVGRRTLKKINVY